MEELNPDAMKIDGFDDCIIGICTSFKGSTLLYSENKVIRKLMKDMSEDEAWEYYDYNILEAYMSPYRPVFSKEIPF